MKITANNKKIKTITAIDLKPRDNSILALIGKSRIFADHKRKAKRDKVGRKNKYKFKDE